MTTRLPFISLPDAIFASPAASILLPVTLGTAVGYSSPKQARRIYMSIRQPPLRPPAWVFGPVWTILYGMMGYAAHRAHIRGAGSVSDALYTAQLALNIAWTPLFFGLRRPIEATVDIVALLGLNTYLGYAWYTSVDRTAGLLQVPYVAWLSFATYLSAGVGYLNRWTLPLVDEKDGKQA